MDQAPDLNDAIARLKAFRSTWNPGAVIDQETADMASRCRLYTSNDEDAVIEHVSAYMWERRMERVEDRTPWAEADATWQTAFREMAVAAQQALTMP